MSDSITHDTIAAELALLAEQPALVRPADATGYGSDLDLSSGDMTADASEISLTSRIALAQDLAHLLSSKRGQIPDAPDEGFDVVGLLHAGMTPEDIVAAAGQITNQVTKDDRVDTATTRLAVARNGDCTVDIRVIPLDPDLAGPFRLILAVTDGTTLLQAILSAP